MERLLPAKQRQDSVVKRNVEQTVNFSGIARAGQRLYQAIE